MEETGDLRFLSQGETGLTRLVCPECGGALAEAVRARMRNTPDTGTSR